MEIIAYTGYEKYPVKKWIYTVEIRENRVLDIKVDTGTGLCYVMQNHDGTTVYDPRTGKTYPGYPYSEKETIDLVRNSYQNGSEKLLEVCEKVKADIQQLGRFGFIYGPCCKKGITCTCGKLSEIPESADCKWCFHNNL